MCVCVYVWDLLLVRGCMCGFFSVWGCMCGFCNVLLCVCVGFVMCGCVYVWIL